MNQEMHFRLERRRYGDISAKTRNFCLNMLYIKTIVGIDPDLVDFIDTPMKFRFCTEKYICQLAYVYSN